MISNWPPSAELQNDWQVVLTAVANTDAALEHVSAELKANKVVALTALSLESKSRGHWYGDDVEYYVPLDLRADKQVLLCCGAKFLDRHVGLETTTLPQGISREHFRLGAARVHAFGGADTWRLVAVLQRLAFAAVFTGAYSGIEVEYASKGGVAPEIRDIHAMGALRFTPTNIGRFDGRTAIHHDQYREDAGNEAAAYSAVLLGLLPAVDVVERTCGQLEQEQEHVACCVAPRWYWRDSHA